VFAGLSGNNFIKQAVIIVYDENGKEHTILAWGDATGMTAGISASTPGEIIFFEECVEAERIL